MGKLIKISDLRAKSSGVLASDDSEAKRIAPEGPVLASFEEDQAFLDLVHEWPCFQGAERAKSLHALFDLYYDDELALAQDCVLEFLFHMHDPHSAFDIGNALYTWEDADRSFFLLSLTLHSELIDQIKQEDP